MTELASTPAVVKLGFGTYGMKDVDVFEAAPGLRRIGYDVLELAACDGWPCAPRNLDRTARGRLRELLCDSGFPAPVLLANLSPLESGAKLEAQRGEFDAICTLAGDLNFGTDLPIVTTTLGGVQLDWDGRRRMIRDRLLKWADAALGHRVVLALEPHYGGCFDRPEKAAWLMDHTRHPALKLNFDYSHFHLQGLDLRYCLELLGPHAVHMHIKDGALHGGAARFQLPGDGTLDLRGYMRDIVAFGIGLPVTVEVSAMLWRQPGYDPWLAARRSFEALDAARRLLCVRTMEEAR